MYGKDITPYGSLKETTQEKTKKKPILGCELQFNNCNCRAVSACRQQAVIFQDEKLQDTYLVVVVVVVCPI